MVNYIYTKTIDCGGHVKINSIPYCSECSKVIDKAWDYCPFCGDNLWYKNVNEDEDGKEDEDGREE